MQIFIGHDPREEQAYEVARDTLVKRTKFPLNIIPLRLEHLSMLKRPIEMKDGKMWDPISQAPMSTEFAISRFCVPFLEDEGWALFCDCDIICWEDIRNLFELADGKYAVQVVKHEQKQSTETKMDGQIQTYYARKNWSSVVLWNCSHPANKGLTELRLNQWPGRDLHAFKWLDDSEIGELPQKWNWLIDVTEGEPKREGIWHYTLGLPFFYDEVEWDEYDKIWQEEARECGVLV